MTLPAFLDRRFVVVTGKGGVGRTTVAAALGLAAGRAGKRVAVVEISGAAEVAEAFGLADRAYAPRAVAPRVDTFSLTPRECLDDFGRRKLRLGALARKALNNRVTRAFYEAVPGLHDLQQLGKLENLVTEPLPDDPHYDLVILDAPATGHGLTLLAAAKSMAEITRVGPFHDLALSIAAFLSDASRTAVVLVTLPEALPIFESLELAAALRADGARLAGIVVNQVQPSPVPAEPPWEVVRAGLVAAGWEDVARIADDVVARGRDQAVALADLEASLADVPRVLVPRVIAPDGPSRVLGAADALAGAR